MEENFPRTSHFLSSCGDNHWAIAHSRNGVRNRHAILWIPVYCRYLDVPTETCSSLFPQLATAGDAAGCRLKTEVAADLFRIHPQISVRQLPHPFDEVRERLKREDFRRVAAAVHSRAARRSIQFETSEVVWDAGATETGEFFVWRVAFGRSPCLVCRLSQESVDPEQAKAHQLAAALGLSTYVWYRKIRDNEVFSQRSAHHFQPPEFAFQPLRYLTR